MLLHAGVGGVSAEAAAKVWAGPGDAAEGVVRLSARSRETTEVVGGVGLSRGELSFFVARALWGQGYGTAMVRAFLQQADERMGLVVLLARIQRENLASRRLVERVGFRFCGLERRPDGLPFVLRYERRVGWPDVTRGD